MLCWAKSKPKGPKGPTLWTFRHSPRAICTVGLILEILCCDPKGRRALLRVPSTEGRGVCLCWALSKPKGPKRIGYSSNSSNSKGPDVIRKKALPFYRTSSGVRLCWELDEPKGPQGCVRGWRSYERLTWARCLWRERSVWINSKLPKRAAHYPLYTSLCTGELNTIRKLNAFSAILSTEGRVVGPCWEKFKPKGPQAPPMLEARRT